MKSPLFLVPDVESEYQLIDSGNGLRYERFGNNYILRPDSMAYWELGQCKQIDASCIARQNGQFEWTKHPSFNPEWKMTVFDGLSFELRGTTSKNIGIFPEQLSQWRWISDKITEKIKVGKSCSVLNLFAYTGGATLAVARAGAEVCHLDASKSVVAWAKRNAELSGLSDKPIRWIVDDALTFVRREVRRKRVYDMIIMDPPAMGHTPSGKLLTFDEMVLPLLEALAQLAPDPDAFIFNAYALGYPPVLVKNLLADFYPHKEVEAGELGLVDQRGNRLSCSIFARF